MTGGLTYVLGSLSGTFSINW